MPRPRTSKDPTLSVEIPDFGPPEGVDGEVPDFLPPEGMEEVNPTVDSEDEYFGDRDSVFDTPIVRQRAVGDDSASQKKSSGDSKPRTRFWKAHRKKVPKGIFIPSEEPPEVADYQEPSPRFSEAYVASDEVEAPTENGAESRAADEEQEQALPASTPSLPHPPKHHKQGGEKRRFSNHRREAGHYKPPKVERPRQNNKVRYTQWTLIVLLAMIPFSVFLGIRALASSNQQKKAIAANQARVEAQFKELGASSQFPIADAEAKARRLAYECFTVPVAGSNLANADKVDAQNVALTEDGVPAGSQVNCGWDGNGRGKVDDMQVVSDPYWIHATSATVILQLKLYQRPGFIYYYVPFVSSGNVAQFAGMPTIFGTASGAEDFLRSCSGVNDSLDIAPMRRTAQLFLGALAGDNTINLDYLTYGSSSFGGFGPTVTAPTITQAQYCGANGNERLFEALVQFTGPIEGGHYTLPYAFGLVPNPQTKGQYQVKDFGPAPSYSGN